MGGGVGQREKEREREKEKSQIDSPLSAEADSELYLTTLRL